MARRVKPTINNKYTQPLKLGFKNRQVIASNNSYNSVMTKLSSKPVESRVNAWMRFNSNTFDGVQMVAGLQKGKRILTSASCVFKIYAFSVDNLWTETLLTTVSGSQMTDGRFNAVATESLFSPVSIDGEITFKLEVEITRLGKTYSEIYYFNHVGIYDSFIRLKRDVEFLDLTKADE